MAVGNQNPQCVTSLHNRPMKMLAALASLLAVLLLAACRPQAAPPQTLVYQRTPSIPGLPVYRLAIHPLHNPRKLMQVYQPVVDHLNRHLQGVQIELEASRDYQAYEQKYRDRAPAFLIPNPWQTLDAIRSGYHVMLMVGDAQDFRGLLVVRRDGGIRVPADLKGQVVSYPSHTALAAAIMTQYFLHTQGLNLRSDLQNVYVGSQESTIMNVYLGQAAAGGTWTLPWRRFQKEHPTEAAQLAVAWETPPLVNLSMMARDDVPVALREQVGQLLLALADTPQGRAILEGMETGRFHVASDASYEPVARYIERFEKEVRQVSQP